jgi:inorganic pyrophosphatase
MLREFEHFFTVYKDLEDMKTATKGWEGAAEAISVLRAAGAVLEEEN